MRKHWGRVGGQRETVGWNFSCGYSRKRRKAGVSYWCMQEMKIGLKGTGYFIISIVCLSARGTDTARPKVVNKADGWSRVHGRLPNHQIRKLETWLLQLSPKRIQFPPLRVKNLSLSYPSKKEEKERSKKERKGKRERN